MIDLSRYRVLDLGLTLDDRIAGFASAPAKDLDQDGWNARTLHLYSHAGTHMDAPHHFGMGAGMDHYPVVRFVTTAWLASIPIVEDRQLLGVDDLGSLAHDFPAGDSLLLATGWSDHLGRPKYRDALPRIGTELAHWCVSHRVNILGVEAPSVADVNDLPEVTEIHQILLGGDVIIVEGLANLDRINAPQVLLIALPLDIAGGDGAPARVIALEEKKMSP